MFQKLEDVEKKYIDLTEKISDPEVISRQNEWKVMKKEHSELEPIVEKYREYKKVEKNLEEAKESYEFVWVSFRITEWCRYQGIGCIADLYLYADI